MCCLAYKKDLKVKKIFGNIFKVLKKCCVKGKQYCHQLRSLKSSVDRFVLVGELSGVKAVSVTVVK